MSKLCDECETVAHCMKHGCIPKQQALDKKAENARKLGLDYEPAQQEPVGEVSGHDWSTGILYRDLEPGAPLYTSPPAQRKPLTEEQVNLFINGRGDEDDDDYVEPTGDGFGLTDADLVRLVRRVEAAHGIKENT